MAEKEVIIDFKIDVGQSIEYLTEIDKQMRQLTADKKALDKAIKDGTATEEQIKQYNEVQAALKSLSRLRAAEMREVYQEAQQYRYAADTIQGMSDRLRQMKDEYVKLSAEVRNSDYGKNLAQDIRETTTAINVMKAEMQPSFIEKFNEKIISVTASFNRFPKTLSGLKTGLATITSAFKVLFKTIIMNPIGLLITAITGLVVIISKFFKETEAGQRIMNVFGGSIDKITEGLKMMVNGIATAIEWVLRLIPAYKKASDNAEAYAAAVEKVRQQEEELAKQREKDQDLAQRNLSKAMDETLSQEARLNWLDEYRRVSMKILDDEKRLAKGVIDNYQLAKVQGEEITEEMQKKYEQATATVNAYSSKISILNNEFTKYQNQIYASGRKQREEDAKEAEKAAAEAQKSNNKILQETQKLQQELSTLWREIYLSKQEQEIEALDDTYQHNVELINKTIKSEEEKNKMLLDLTNKYRADVAAINKKYDDEAKAKTKDELNKRLTKEEALRQLKAKEAALVQMDLDNKALFNARNNEIERTNIAVEQSERRIAQAEEEYNRIKNLSEDQVSVLYGEGEEGVQKWKNAQQEALNSITSAVQENQLAIEEYKEALKNSQLEVIANFQSVLQGLSTMTSAFKGLFSTLAEDDAEMQKYSNALSYINIMVNMAEGIAGAIAQAQSVPFPANIAAMATGVAAVVTGIAEAISIYKQNKNVKPAPKFAEGGLVGDRTTSRTDDTISAKLSEGEYVIRSKVVRALGVDFFDRINGTKGNKTNRFATGGVVPSLSTIQSVENKADYAALVRAVASIEPVVSVKEINNVQNRVLVKENLSKY